MLERIPKRVRRRAALHGVIIVVIIVVVAIIVVVVPFSQPIFLQASLLLVPFAIVVVGAVIARWVAVAVLARQKSMHTLDPASLLVHLAAHARALNKRGERSSARFRRCGSVLTCGAYIIIEGCVPCRPSHCAAAPQRLAVQHPRGMARQCCVECLQTHTSNGGAKSVCHDDVGMLACADRARTRRLQP
jgi:hypothetical protein